MVKLSISKIFSRKKKVEKTHVVKKIANEHQFTGKKNIQVINAEFAEKLKEAHAENLSSELLDLSNSVINENGMDSKRFLGFFKKKEGRILKKTPNYILQYSKSPNPRGIELSLILIIDKKVSKYQIKIISLKAQSENAILNSSVTKKKYAAVLEKLGVKTIKASLSLFDPITKIDISIYPEFPTEGITRLTDVEQNNWTKYLEKEYKKLSRKNPDLQNTTVDIYQVGTLPLPIYKVVKPFNNYQKGDIIVDTRVN